MPIDFEFAHTFEAAELEQAREMIRSAVPEINLPMDGYRTILQHFLVRPNSDSITEKIKLLLDAGADPNATGKHSATPLMIALEYGANSAKIKLLLDAKADINLGDKDGKTAVFTAVKYRRFDDLRTLLSRGGNINHQDNNGDTPIAQEINCNEPILDFVKLLIELGADINLANKEMRTSLHCSFIGHGRALHIVPSLIESGAKLNVKDSCGASPLALAVSEKSCPIGTIEALVKAGAAIESVDAKGRTPLLCASISGHSDAVKILLDHKASVTHCDGERKSALHLCCKHRAKAIVPLLVNAGADINLTDKLDEKGGGRTPLMYAVRDEKTTQALLKFKPDVNIVDDQKWSALMYAVSEYSDSAAVVEMLLKKRAVVDVRNSDGNTALHLVVKGWGVTNAVKLLLEANADVNAVNGLGETPLMLCRDVSVAELLVKNGANVDAADLSGRTALMRGCTGYGSDSHLKVKLLLNAKANPDIQDNEGNNVLILAATSDSNQKAVKLLVDHGANLDLLAKDGHSATANASPENLMLLIAAGAKPNVFESSRLAYAIDDDNLPLSMRLLERGIKMELSLDRFMKPKKTFEKLARANSELLRGGIQCTDPQVQEPFDALLKKFAKNEDSADDADLPEILRQGAWPLKARNRNQLVLAAGRLNEIAKTIDCFQGSIDWPEELKESTLDQFKKFSPGKNTKNAESDTGSAQQYFASLLQKKGKIRFSSLFKNWAIDSDLEFIKFWNSNGAALDAKILIEVTQKWSRSLDASDIAYLLARFDIAVLPGIIKAAKKATRFAETLRFVDAPGCASLMALWMASGPASRIARQWALKYPATCVKGLIVDAVSKVGKDRSAAEACLRFLASNGQGPVVESVAAQFGDDVAESVAETLAQDYRTDFMPAKSPEIPKFWSADVYPPPRLKTTNKALPVYAIDALANMMALSNSEVRTPALDAVLEACDPKSLANFSWGAFEEWAAKGSKDSEWIFDSLSYLGDDTCARKLTPYIRNWPRENGIARARKGLEILAAIGSDVALSQIQAISQKNKYPSILEDARVMMQVIATARDLKPQQLEDRLVPDFGLSEKGEIALNFGPRHFIGCVDAQLKPFIRDASGAVLKALPAMGKEDEKILAKECTAEWSDLCKELKPVAKLQLERLELAMVNSRRWTGADFKTLFVVSPLLQNLVKGLVWGVFPTKAKLSASFMVTAENAFVDADGKVVKISDGSSIGIVHPLFLDEASLGAWQKLFAKNKQLQPFSQLVRKTYRAKDDTGKDRFGLDGATVASKALKGLLAMGWSTGVGDAGWIESFDRRFSSGYATLSAEPGVHITDYEYNSKEQKLEVSIPDTLNAMEFSEVIRELQTLKK
jgi:ankyrin repeat protein